MHLQPEQPLSSLRPSAALAPPRGPGHAPKGSGAAPSSPIGWPSTSPAPPDARKTRWRRHSQRQRWCLGCACSGKRVGSGSLGPVARSWGGKCGSAEVIAVGRLAGEDLVAKELPRGSGWFGCLPCLRGDGGPGRGGLRRRRHGDALLRARELVRTVGRGMGRGQVGTLRPNPRPGRTSVGRGRGAAGLP